MSGEVPTSGVGVVSRTTPFTRGEESWRAMRAEIVVVVGVDVGVADREDRAETHAEDSAGR